MVHRRDESYRRTDQLEKLQTAKRSIAGFQTLVGLFLGLVGTMMLVTPHQFASLTYAALQPHLSLWAIAFLLSGGALVVTAMLGLPRPVELCAHLLGGATLLALAYSFTLLGAWPGTTNLGSLGLVTATAPLLRRFRGLAPGPRSDPFVVVVGLGSLLTAAILLLLPGQFSSPLFDPIRSLLPLFGAAFLLSGLLLAAIILRPDAPPAVYSVGYFVAGITLVAYFFGTSLPNRAWIGIFYYGGFGIAMLLLPLWQTRLKSIDQASLRIRFAVALAAVAVVPLLFSVSFTLDRQEGATIQMALSQRQELASAVARDVADYVGFHRAAVAALAAQPGLLDLSPESRRAALKAANSAFPAAYTINLLDAAGNQISRSDDLPLRTVAGQPMFEQMKRTNQPQVDRGTSQANVPTLTIGAPVSGTGGQAKGYVSAGIELSTVAKIVARAASSKEVNAYLVDGRGVAIAHPDTTLVNSSADLSTQPAVAAMLAAQADSGSLIQGPTGGQGLAVYARVPDLGWGVVLEQPLSTVLAESRGQRDVILVFLILSAILAGIVGAVIADNLVSPLRRVMRALHEISSGNRQIELPETKVTEVRLVSEAVGKMRDRLAETEVTRERLMEESEGQRRLLASVIEKAQAGIAVFRGRDFVCEVVNPVYRAFAPGKQMMGRPFAEVWPETTEVLLPILTKVLDTGKPFATTNERALVQRSHDGPLEEAYWTYSAIRLDPDESGQAGILITAIETSAQVMAIREREQLLVAEHEARRLAEAAVRDRDEFLSVAAHELKTPITSLRGFAEVLLRQIRKTGELDLARVEAAMSQIDRQSARLATLVNQLLDLSRIESGQLRLVKVVTDIPPLIEGMIGVLQHVHREASFAVRVQGLAIAEVDPLRLEQVIANLLENAVKFSPKGSTINVEVGTTDEGVRIAVRDRGRGIPAEKRSRVFERFYQAHGEEWYGGMGLGLFISRQIVELHGGSIEVDCPPDGGTCVTVQLPQRADLAGELVPEAATRS